MSAKDPFDFLLIDLTYSSDALDVIQRALEQGMTANHVFSATQQNALALACGKDDLPAVELLLSLGADPNVNIDTWPENLPIFAAKSLAVAKLLVQHGARTDVNARFGQTVLHLACLRSNIELATLFLDQGVVVDEPNDFGQTPLHYSCTRLIWFPKDKSQKQDFQSGTSRELSLPLIKLLLSRGASMSKCDITGLSPEGYSVKNHCDDEIAKCILGIEYFDHEIFQALRSLENDVVIDWLENGNNPNIIERCETLVHVAATAGNCVVLEELLSRGAEPDEQLTPPDCSNDYMYGRTPLFSACERAVFPETRQAMQMLIAAGANLNTPCKDNITPFLRLCEIGDARSIRMMIDHAYDQLMSGELIPARTRDPRPSLTHNSYDWHSFYKIRTVNDVGNMALKFLCQMYIADETSVKDYVAAQNRAITNHQIARQYRQKAFTVFNLECTDDTLEAQLKSSKLCREARSNMIEASDAVCHQIDFLKTDEYKTTHERLGNLIQRLQSLVEPNVDVQKLLDQVAIYHAQDVSQVQDPTAIVPREI